MWQFTSAVTSSHRQTDNDTHNMSTSNDPHPVPWPCAARWPSSCAGCLCARSSWGRPGVTRLCASAPPGNAPVCTGLAGTARHTNRQTVSNSQQQSHQRAPAWLAQLDTQSATVTLACTGLAGTARHTNSQQQSATVTLACTGLAGTARHTHTQTVSNSHIRVHRPGWHS